MDAMLHSFQSRLIFPSWTSRVRSPSPAFRLIYLRAFRFRKYSKYSVKEVVRPEISQLPDTFPLKAQAFLSKDPLVSVTSNLDIPRVFFSDHPSLNVHG